MKKMIQLLTIISIMILGINGVKAGVLSSAYNFSNGKYSGICNQPPSLSGSCYYKCGIYDEETGKTFEFNYSMIKKYDKTKEEIVYVTDISDMKFYQYEIGTKNIIYQTEVSEKTINVKQYPNTDQAVENTTSVCPPLVLNIEITSSMTGGTSATTTSYYDIYLKNDPAYVPYKPTEIDSSCGLLGGESSKIVLFLQKIFKYIKIAIPILIITLGIADFIKVVGTGKDDDMKKAINRFIKRIIIAVIFILVPFFISLIINISGVTSEYSGIDDGLKAVFCILK